MSFDFARILDDLKVFAHLLILIAIPVSLLMFHVWNQYRITELGYEVSSMTTEHRNLLEKNRKLRIEETFRGRPNTVARAARKTYSFSLRQPSQVVEVGTRDGQKTVDLTKLLRKKDQGKQANLLLSTNEEE